MDIVTFDDGFYNPTTGAIFLGGSFRTQVLDSAHCPNSLGLEIFKKHFQAPLRRKTEFRFDGSAAGRPKIMLDIYDLDGRIVVGSFDTALELLNFLRHGEKYAQNVVAEADKTPQPYGQGE